MTSPVNGSGFGGSEEVLIPSGLPIAEAAARVGASCWIELTLHQILTGWLGDETDPSTSARLWVVRAHRAELAEAWHRRLPELREMPREGFVVPPQMWAERLAPDSAFANAAGSTERLSALREVLDEMRRGYLEHQDTAVGPADGPVADTLRQAVSRTDADLRCL